MTRVSKSRRQSVLYLTDIINQATGVDIKRERRQRAYVEGRAMAYVIIRKFLGLSYQQIGLLFNKHHASIMHAVKEWPYMVKFNKDLETMYIEVYNSWSGKEGAKPFLTCEEKLKHLEEQINLLTLQLAEAKSLNERQLNQPTETDESIRRL